MMKTLIVAKAQRKAGRPSNADTKIFFHVAESMNKKMIRQKEAITRNSRHTPVREMTGDYGTNFVATGHRGAGSRRDSHQTQQGKH